LSYRSHASLKAFDGTFVPPIEATLLKGVGSYLGMSLAGASWQEWTMPHGLNRRVGSTKEANMTSSEAKVISAAFPYQKQRRQILGREMAYVEVGDGDPILLLHGNPTSSYLWRNVLPHLKSRGRCIAPDLIGMGDSDKLLHSGPESYRFVEHRRYLDALLDDLDVH